MKPLWMKCTSLRSVYNVEYRIPTADIRPMSRCRRTRSLDCELAMRCSERPLGRWGRSFGIVIVIVIVHSHSHSHSHSDAGVRGTCRGRYVCLKSRANSHVLRLPSLPSPSSSSSLPFIRSFVHSFIVLVHHSSHHQATNRARVVSRSRTRIQRDFGRASVAARRSPRRRRRRAVVSCRSEGGSRR